MPAHRAPSAFTLVIALIGAACGPETGSEVGRGAESEPPGEVLFSESPPVWFEAYFTWLEVSPDGERAVFDYRRLVDLRTGEELEMPGDLDVVFRARFDADGSLMIGGRRGEQQGWFRPEAERPGDAPLTPDETLPARYVIVPSPSGDRFGYWLDDEPRMLLTIPRVGAGGSVPEPRAVEVPGRLAGLAWLPDGDSLVAYAVDEAGAGRLDVVDPLTGGARRVAEGLDGSSTGPRLAVSGDGSAVRWFGRRVSNWCPTS